MTVIHGEPFEFGGYRFVCTSIAADQSGETELEAYHLVEPLKFRGGEAGAKNGWLHGEPVVHGGRTWILQGPPAIFVAEPRRPCGDASASPRAPAPGFRPRALP